ncbi:sodium/pantothenate symporter [Pyramidobacter piscolens]|uniref:sodium/pantothenate symporter n=1 Tax=Pyramidobacter piscolens TaxID=638849 RepID=UPI002665291C|nr:sodium/pantothenate symporter [Pyramidobacter piscolens]
MINWPLLTPVLAYLAGVYLLALYSGARMGRSKNFLSEYFIGSRSMGGFVLAMTLVATYTSASSFIGGPGVAYRTGLGWVLLAVIQVPTAWLTLGVLGKKFAIVARRIDAITVNDFLRERYRSPLLVVVASVSLILFFLSAMTAQFIGGARLFETITGLPYLWGLVIFAGTVILYTTVGGFRAVALTDALQGMVMILGTIAMIWGISVSGGGMKAVMGKIAAADPALLTPFGPDNFIAKPFILSFWVLVCFGTVGLPHTAVRCMGYKDSRSMHGAIVIGTFVVSFIMLGMHLCGALGSAVLPGLEVPDSIMPQLAVKVLPPAVAGLFLAGPLAGVMSTIDSQLIQMSSTIVKDLYINYVDPAAAGDERRVKKLSFFSTAVLGAVVFLAAVRPPSLIVWLNLFAFGGMEAAFLWPLVLGLYWRRANAAGALASAVCGVGCYFVMGAWLKNFYGMNVIVPSLIIGLSAFVAVSLLTPPPPADVIDTFWGE